MQRGRQAGFRAKVLPVIVEAGHERGFMDHDELQRALEQIELQLANGTQAIEPAPLRVLHDQVAEGVAASVRYHYVRSPLYDPSDRPHLRRKLAPIYSKATGDWFLDRPWRRARWFEQDGFELVDWVEILAEPYAKRAVERLTRGRT
jgi:hypothetical protein